MRSLYSLFFLSISILFCSCTVQNSKVSHQQNIVQIKYKKRMDFVQPAEGKLITLTDSIYISYSADKLVMKIPVPVYKLDKLVTDSGIVFTDDESPVLKMNFNYIVINRNDSSAMFYSSDSSKTVGQLINGDSAFRKQVPALLNIVDSKIDKLSYRIEGSDYLTEAYIPVVKPDESFSDSTVLKYSKTMGNVPFSFSKDLDLKAGMKLYSVRFVTVQQLNTKTKVVIPQHEFSFSIELLPSSTDPFVNFLLK